MGLALKTTTEIYQFGKTIGTEINQKSKELCNHLTGSDLNKEVKEDLENLVKLLKRKRPPETSNFVIKRFYSFRNKLSDLKVENSSVETSIEDIIERFNNHEYELQRDLSVLGNFRKHNSEKLNQLEELLKFATTNLQELENEIKELDEIKEKTYEISEQLDQKQSSHFQLSKKMLELNQMKAVCLGDNKRISIIESGHLNLLNKLTECRAIAIPLWRSSFVISAVINNQKTTSEIIDAVSDFTNNLIVENSKNLKESSFQIARQATETVVKNESIKISMNNLIETVKGCQTIYTENTKKIKECRNEIENAHEKLLNISVDKAVDRTLKINKYK